MIETLLRPSEIDYDFDPPADIDFGITQLTFSENWNFSFWVLYFGLNSEKWRCLFCPECKSWINAIIRPGDKCPKSDCQAIRKWT